MLLYEKADIDILSPYDGIIHKLLVDAGEIAVANEPLVVFRFGDDVDGIDETDNSNSSNNQSKTTPTPQTQSQPQKLDTKQNENCLHSKSKKKK